MADLVSLGGPAQPTNKTPNTKPQTAEKTQTSKMRRRRRKDALVDLRSCILEMSLLMSAGTSYRVDSSPLIGGGLG